MLSRFHKERAAVSKQLDCKSPGTRWVGVCGGLGLVISTSTRLQEAGLGVLLSPVIAFPGEAALRTFPTL